jgi:hypothetical protein
MLRHPFLLFWHSEPNPYEIGTGFIDRLDIGSIFLLRERAEWWRSISGYDQPRKALHKARNQSLDYARVSSVEKVLVATLGTWEHINPSSVFVESNPPEMIGKHNLLKEICALFHRWADALAGATPISLNLSVGSHAKVPRDLASLFLQLGERTNQAPRFLHGVHRNLRVAGDF